MMDSSILKRFSPIICLLFCVVTLNLALPRRTLEESTKTLKREAAPHPEDSIYIIGAGLGTTGTHLTYGTTCYMGYPSVHYHTGCTSANITSDKKKHVKYEMGAQELPQKSHFTLLKLVHQMKQCVSKEKGSCGDALQWRDIILKHLEIVVSDSSIAALHDTPYTLLMPSLLEFARKHHKKTLIILSERDPEVYAKRRIEEHPNGLVCIDRSIPISTETSEGGVYDWIGCINRAARPGESFTDLTEVFTTHKQVGREVLAQETKAYQDAVRPKAAFAWDIFKRENRTSEEQLSLEMAEIFPNLAQYRQPMRKFRVKV